MQGEIKKIYDRKGMCFVRVVGVLPLFREDIDPRIWAKLEVGDELRFEIVHSPREPGRVCVGGNVELMLSEDRADWERLATIRKASR
jgi:hypothetical protein